MKSRKIINRTTSLAIAATICGASLLALAKGPHDGAIKARQGMFQTYSFNSGILGDMAKEKIPYDADIASEAAANLAAAANFGQSQMWPAGSDTETDGNAPTRALPAIWENFPDVAEKGKRLSQTATALSAVAGDGLGALQGAMGDVGASCKACHDEYRAERK